ncbi:hypothetical protein PMSD_05055 [Paenibacillus macquariensis subsp. defensor]|nr:hypothetical protein PMSD_05055 [Paenibacillus macquariensis subsp. defensor]
MTVVNESVKVKECSKCTNLLSLTSFHDKKKNKDGKDNWCRTCRNDYLVMWREQKFKEDPYMSLLSSSTQNAYYRGQPEYVTSPYEKVLCEWDSPSDFLHYLEKDEAWMKAWKRQVDIYLESGDPNDKASIDRIDSNGNYSANNIQVKALGENKLLGSSKPCEVWIIKDKQMNSAELVDVPSKKDLKQILIGRDIPYSLIKSIDEGVIHDVGNNMQIIIQTKDGKLHKGENPLYILKAHYRKYLINLDTNEEFLVTDEHSKFNISGLRLNRKQE